MHERYIPARFIRPDSESNKRAIVAWVLAKYREGAFIAPIKVYRFVLTYLCELFPAERAPLTYQGEVYSKSNEASPASVTTLPTRLIDYFMTIRVDMSDPIVEGQDGKLFGGGACMLEQMWRGTHACCFLN